MNSLVYFLMLLHIKIVLIIINFFINVKSFYRYFPEAPTACSFNMRHEGPDPHRSPRELR